MKKNYSKENRKEFLSSFFLKKDLSDLEIEFEDGNLPAHSFILMARSKIFKEIIQPNQKKIKFEQSENSIRHFLYFIYSFEYAIPNDTKSRFELLDLLKTFEFDDFKQELIEFIIDDLNHDNVGEVLEKSQKYQISEIENECFDQIISLGEKFLKSDELLKLRFHNIKSIIASDELQISEFELLQTVYRYSNQFPNPIEILEDLIHLIRFPLMNQMELCLIYEMDLLSHDEILQLFLVCSSKGEFGKTKFSSKSRNFNKKIDVIE